MKNLLLLLLLLLLGVDNIFAGVNYELKLYEKILPIILKEESIVVYADSGSSAILKDSRVFKVTDRCLDASLLIGKRFENIDIECLKKPIFATSYRSFKSYKNSFGAFYWRKGRPQIKFKKEKIDKLKLFLPDSLSKYTTQ